MADDVLPEDGHRPPQAESAIRGEGVIDYPFLQYVNEDLPCVFAAVAVRPFRVHLPYHASVRPAPAEEPTRGGSSGSRRTAMARRLFGDISLGRLQRDRCTTPLARQGSMACHPTTQTRTASYPRLCSRVFEVLLKLKKDKKRRTEACVLWRLHIGPCPELEASATLILASTSCGELGPAMECAQPYWITEYMASTNCPPVWCRRYHYAFYPFMRLLLPSSDSVRGEYGLKEKKIAEYVIEMMGLRKDGQDAQKLKRWKTPGASNDQSFSDAVYHLMITKGWTKESAPGSDGGFTVAELNKELDRLRSTRRDQKKQVFHSLLRRLGALEVKWLIRIITKEMKINASHDFVLRALHPDAKDHYDNGQDLRAVCEKCCTRQALAQAQNGAQTLAARTQLFKPFIPMLCSHLDSAKLALLEKGGAWMAEPKYDGDRVMIHGQGERIEFWTRAQNNATEQYGPRFSCEVLSRVRSGTKSFVLDGEMLVWNRAKKQFKAFGGNRTFARGASAAQEDENFCYMVFDLVSFDGKDLSLHSLADRRRQLEKLIPEKDNILQARPFEPPPLQCPVDPDNVLKIVPHVPVRSATEVKMQLLASIHAGNEGIVIKDMNSQYHVNQKGPSWLKLKEDYLEGLADTLDLVVMGGYHHKKNDKQHMTFLLGVRAATPAGLRVHSLCKVGSGYLDSELSTMINPRLEHKWRRYVSSAAPPEWDGWQPGSGEVPDVWVPAESSVVFEVRAYEVVDSTKFKYERLRTDRSFASCLDVQGLQDLRNVSVGGKRRASLGAGDLVFAKEQKKARRAAGRGAPRSPARGAPSVAGTVANLGEVQRISSLFYGMEVCVLCTTGKGGQSQADIEKMVLAHGGTRVANPTLHTTWIVADGPSVKVNNWRQTCRSGQNGVGDRDILHVDWLTLCVKESRMVDPLPRWMVYQSRSTEQALARDIDPFGDSYVTDTTSGELSTVLDKVQQSDWQATVQQALGSVDTSLSLLEQASSLNSARSLLAGMLDICLRDEPAVHTACFQGLTFCFMPLSIAGTHTRLPGGHDWVLGSMPDIKCRPDLQVAVLLHGATLAQEMCDEVTHVVFPVAYDLVALCPLADFAIRSPEATPCPICSPDLGMPGCTSTMSASTTINVSASPPRF
eukprot:gene9424-243_t